MIVARTPIASRLLDKFIEKGSVLNIFRQYSGKRFPQRINNNDGKNAVHSRGCCTNNKRLCINALKLLWALL